MRFVLADRGLSQVALLCAALLSSACSGSCGADAVDAGRPPVASPTPTPHATPTPPAPPAARVTRVEGEGASVQAGAALSRGARVETTGGRVVADFAEGGRFELEPNALGRLGDSAPQEVLLARGVVRGVLPPSGNSPRPPMRLATAAGVVVLPGSGDVLVASLPGGRAWVAVLRGSVRVLVGDVDAEGAPTAITLVAGHALALTPTPAEPTLAPATLADARALALGLLAAAEATDLEGTCAPMAQALASAVRDHTELIARGERLREQQRSLARTDAPAARRLLPELVAHSRALIRSTERLRVWQERSAALTLAGCPAAPSRPAAQEELSR